MSMDTHCSVIFSKLLKFKCEVSIVNNAYINFMSEKNRARSFGVLNA